jgi:hypothetical protein
MVAIPVGIPFAIGKVLYGYHDAILLHEGPHEFESLYIKYRPECYMYVLLFICASNNCLCST